MKTDNNKTISIKKNHVLYLANNVSHLSVRAYTTLKSLKNISIVF